MLLGKYIKSFFIKVPNKLYITADAHDLTFSYTSICAPSTF